MTKEKPSRAARFMVLSGPALALLFTLYVLVSGSGASLLFAAWFWAAIWTFLAALTGALWRGIRRRDWSAFTGYSLPEQDADSFEWTTRTGRYAWRRDYEEGGLYDDDPFDHGPIT